MARERNRRGSLVGRLVATFLLLSVAMVAVVGALAYVRARDSLEASAFSRLSAAQTLTSDALNRWVDEQRRNVTFTSGLLGGAEREGTLPGAHGQVAALLGDASSPAARAAAAQQVRGVLTYQTQQTSDAQELLVVNLDGTVVVSSLPAHEGLDLSRLAAVSQGASAITVQPVEDGPLAPGPTMLVTTPLYDDSGRREGILIGVLDLVRLDSSLLQVSGAGVGGKTYLVDHESRLVPSDRKITSLGIDSALAKTSGQAVYEDDRGSMVLGTYTWLPSMGAALVSEVDEQLAFEPARRLAYAIGITGLVVVALLSALIVLAARRVASPILAITRTAEQVRAGDLTSEAPVTTNDEVGTLATTFNEMTSQLRENVEQLERRVDERTMELRTQKRYFEALVEISPAAVVTMDTHQCVTGWNPAAKVLFGYEPGEAIGRPIDELVLAPGDMRAEGADLARRALATGYAESVTQRQRKDGSLVDVEVVTVPLVVDDELVGSYAVYHDITELEAARRTADSANEAKSAFLATVSHEIRTPMNAIIGMGGLLSDTRLDDEQREYTEAITGSGEALLAIINDILDFSKIEAGRLDLDPHPFDLNECLEATLDLVAPQAAAKGIALALDTSPAMPVELLGDALRVRQIVLNLLSNAVKFTPSGHVVLSASVQPVDAHVADGDRAEVLVSLSVTDTGIGLTPEQQGRLFQSFSQADVSTSRHYGGTGLGLAISKRLAELMGGDATVASPVSEGHGSRFTVTARMGVREPAPDDSVDPALDGVRVAVVEPETIVRDLLVRRLRRLGCVVVEQGEGQSAEVVLASVAAEDGIEAYGDAPVVLMTSGRRGGDVPGRTVGRVSKPVKQAHLVRALHRALGLESADGVAMDADGEIPVTAAAHPLRILLAEDNTLNQKLALALLSRLGYTADVVVTGVEAIDAVRRSLYDVVLMDVQMPEMDGLEATRHIVAEIVDRPRIVALTANAMAGDREVCLAAGMDDFLSKPLRPTELTEVLGRVRRREVDDATPSAAAVSASQRVPLLDADADTTAHVGVREQDPEADSLRSALRAHVREMAGGEDEELERELIDEFLRGLPSLLADLEQATTDGDQEKLRRSAHTLKSHAVLLGATSLEQRTRELESAAARGDEVDGDLVAEVVADAHGIGASLAGQAVGPGAD